MAARLTCGVLSTWASCFTKLRAAPKALDLHSPVTQTLAEHILVCTLKLSSLLDPGSRKRRHHLPA
jgi:hypothetical protein